MSARWLAALLLLTALAPACSSPELTQVVVVVDSDDEDFTRVTLSFEGLSNAEPIDIDVTSDPLPRRVTLVHDGGRLGPFGVTASAFRAGDNVPVLVEPRRGLFFERDHARMLKIDLLHDCIDHCEAGEACFDGPTCAASDSPDATRLRPWEGEVRPLRPNNGSAGSDSIDQPGGGGGGGDQPVDDGGMPGTIDSGTDASVIQHEPVLPEPDYPYTPTNFDPEATTIPAERAAVVLDCAAPSFDSDTLLPSNWCGVQPFVTMVQQGDSSEAALLVMDTLQIAADTTLRLTGSRPVIFAVYGDVEVFGGIDASAAGTVPGAGGNIGCGAAAGAIGTSVPSGLSSASGGGGGGFGTSGGRGGASNETLQVAGGTVLGEPTLSPLRGGCPGGDGGLGNGTMPARGGAGGGALQISAAGRIDVRGFITASGSGGGATEELRDGGGGGGSGGAILIEGDEVIVDSAALVIANGGGGGGGNATAANQRATAGADPDQSMAPAAGGDGPNSGGNGGSGAARGVDAQNGEDAEMSSISNEFGAGGGGGGGAGRIVIRQANAACIQGDVFSPAIDNVCAACTDCVMQLPSSDCEIVDSDTQSYVHCTDAKTWAEAQAACASVGMTLARVEDDAEQTFLTDLVREYTWLGASDAATEGEWQWQPSGQPFWSEPTGVVGGAYTDWALRQPDNGPPEQDCLAESQFGWFDYACDDTLAYLCEH
jgi:hypothetical protein